MLGSLKYRPILVATRGGIGLVIMLLLMLHYPLELLFKRSLIG